MPEEIENSINELRAGLGATALADRIEAKRAGFDLLRYLKFPTGIKCFLLKGSDTQKLFAVFEVTSGWYIEWQDERGQMKFSYATIESSFPDLIAQTSFIAFGVPDAENDLDVYAIDPDRRDVVPPSGDQPWWRVYAVRVAQRRFRIEG